MLLKKGAQWLSGRVLDSRPKGRGFEPHRRHCVVSLSKNINPSLVLVQPRKTRPFITERLLMGRKESNQTNKQMLLKMLLSGTSYIILEEIKHTEVGTGEHYKFDVINKLILPNFCFQKCYENNYKMIK